jgi:hypothetical protein
MPFFLFWVQIFVPNIAALQVMKTTSTMDRKTMDKSVDIRMLAAAKSTSL